MCACERNIEMRDKTTAIFLTAIFAAMSHMNAATPALPDPVDGVVTLANSDYVLTENDDLTGITEFVTTGGWLVFDMSQDETVELAAKVTGTGGIEKRGAGKLFLKSATCNDKDESLDYKTTLGLHVVGGELHLPDFTSYGKLAHPSYGPIVVDAGGKLFMAGSDTVQSTRTHFSNLAGSGLVTNGWRKSQVLQLDTSCQATNFSGVIGGSVGNFYLYPSARINLMGTNSTYTGTAVQPGFGKMGIMCIGYDSSKPSSTGKNTGFNLGPNGGDQTAGIYYLGTNGETTVKSMAFMPWSATTSQKCILDAGAGGIVWNGDFTFSKQPMVHAILQGDGAATNVFGGTMTECAGSSYLEKLGAGTWRIKGSNPRKGVTAVKEGTLQFETLREKGMESSLGLSTFTHSAYSGAINDSKTVPYALLLGGGAKGEATLECVGQDGSVKANEAKDRPLVLAGDGRLKTTCPQPFRLRGVTSIAASPCTLSLDGTNTASSLIDVTNGTSALSVTKDGPGTWTLCGNVGFSGRLTVNDGTLVVMNASNKHYTWFKYTIKTMYAYYIPTSSDGCRVTYEFALYDADGVRRNVGLVSNTNMVFEMLAPGEATAGKEILTGNNYYNWAFNNSSYLLSRMFDDKGDTASFLAGPGNGTNEYNWINVAMRLSDDVPPITSFDVTSTSGGTSTPRRLASYSVSGSFDGLHWDELSNQTTNETSRYSSGWYSNGKAFVAGEVRPLPENGIEIASQPDWAVGSVQLTNVADVVVAAGATLKSDGAVVLRRLGAEIDSAGNVVKGGGTVDGFAVAPKGVFNLSRMPPEGGVVVPYAFSNMVDIANFRTWSVAVNGTAMSKYRIAVMTAGVCVYPVGTLVIMR